MILDTHLHNLVAQFIAAHGDSIEMQRLQHDAMTHLKKRAPHMSDAQVMRTWDILIDALSIEA